MTKVEGLRRSGRARMAVKTYVEERAEEPPPKRKKKTAKSAPTEEVSHLDAQLPSDAHDRTSSDVEEYEAPKKRAKKSRKKSKLLGKVDANGIRRLETTEKRPPGERRPPQIWEVPKNQVKLKDVKGLSLAAEMTDTFQERYQRQVSKIPSLASGQEEYRQKA